MGGEKAGWGHCQQLGSLPTEWGKRRSVLVWHGQGHAHNCKQQLGLSDSPSPLHHPPPTALLTPKGRPLETIEIRTHCI